MVIFVFILMVYYKCNIKQGPLSDDDQYGGNVRKFGYFGNEWPTYGNFNAQSGLKSVIREMESWNALPVRVL